MGNEIVKDNPGGYRPWKKPKPQPTQEFCFGCGRRLKDFEVFMSKKERDKVTCAFCLIALKK
jgi:hypothetical protein